MILGDVHWGPWVALSSLFIGFLVLSATSFTEANSTLQYLDDALSVLQDRYFEIWLGQWPEAIDWTAAVMGTHLVAALSTLSHSISYTMPGAYKQRRLDVEAQMVENGINHYFGHVIAYYFGQNYFSMRTQAFDDMLWVVLGWLETIQLANAHSEMHYPEQSEKHGFGRTGWHGRQFIPAFAHRARVFYELAEEGWDTKLCGGGMNWNPRFLPYKNAITNQLFISASVSMYLHFPGDDNCSPFLDAATKAQHSNWEAKYLDGKHATSACRDLEQDPGYDRKYLVNAIKGYDWLANSGMLNDQGLYTDGFHINGYEKNHSKTTCDQRNEMVYTYNQGVILSGLRGLWEATGNASYLYDGHQLVKNVIRATGDMPMLTTQPPSNQPTMPTWAGLGANGILAEQCDPSGGCSQDGQTFKGIFFHHLTTFCALLPVAAAKRGVTYNATHDLYAWHQESCDAYTPWVIHNARAALRTRDDEGRFGMWWGADPERHPQAVVPKGALDYRNHPTLLEMPDFSTRTPLEVERRGLESSDLNDRGRGRTVETQGGGVAVVRSMWEFERRREEYDERVAVQEL